VRNIKGPSPMDLRQRMMLVAKARDRTEIGPRWRRDRPEIGTPAHSPRRFLSANRRKLSRVPRSASTTNSGLRRTGGTIRPR
jgi:hypothetical protein